MLTSAKGLCCTNEQPLKAIQNIKPDVSYLPCTEALQHIQLYAIFYASSYDNFNLFHFPLFLNVPFGSTCRTKQARLKFLMGKTVRPPTRKSIFCSHSLWFFFKHSFCFMKPHQHELITCEMLFWVMISNNEMIIWSYYDTLGNCGSCLYKPYFLCAPDLNLNPACYSGKWK